MKKTKFIARTTTLFLFLLFGILLGAKSSGLDNLHFYTALGALIALSLLHMKITFRMFDRRLKYH